MPLLFSSESVLASSGTEMFLGAAKKVLTNVQNADYYDYNIIMFNKHKKSSRKTKKNSNGRYAG